MKSKAVSRKITFSKYEDTDRDGVLGLLANLWKGMNLSERDKKFRWRYEQNPYSTSPLIFVAADHDKIIGFRAMVHQKFTRKEEIYDVFSPADAIIDPEYRKMGIFSVLNKMAIEFVNDHFADKGIILNTSSNELSTPAYLNLGWQKTDGRKVYGYKFSLRSIFKKSTFFDDKVVTKGSDKVQFSMHLEPDELSPLFDSRSSDKIQNIRDINFFKWKYSQADVDYQFVRLFENEILQSYVVLKKISEKEVQIEEYYFEKFEQLKLILNCVIKECCFTICRFPIFSNSQKKLADKLGFIIENKYFLNLLRKKRISILVRTSNPKIKEADFYIDGLDLRKCSSWQIFQADAH